MNEPFYGVYTNEAGLNIDLLTGALVTNTGNRVPFNGMFKAADGSLHCIDELGSAGVPGPVGPKGDKGDPGEQGPIGLTGPKGEDGTDAIGRDFGIKIERTGLTQSVASHGILNVMTLIDDLALRTVYAGNCTTSEFSVVSDALRVPNINTYCKYDVVLTLMGTVSGSISDPQEISVELQRANGTVLREYAIIKVMSNNLSRRAVNINTYTTGVTDPYIVDGFKLILNNISNKTINLTGFELLIQGISYSQ